MLAKGKTMPKLLDEAENEMCRALVALEVAMEDAKEFPASQSLRRKITRLDVVYRKSATKWNRILEETPYYD